MLPVSLEGSLVDVAVGLEPCALPVPLVAPLLAFVDTAVVTATEAGVYPLPVHQLHHQGVLITLFARKARPPALGGDALGAAEGALAMPFIGEPLSCVYIAASIPVAALSMPPVLMPLPIVKCSIGINVLTFPFSMVLFPLPGVDVAIGILVPATSTVLARPPFSFVHVAAVSVAHLTGTIDLARQLGPGRGLRNVNELSSGLNCPQKVVLLSG
mmetsp:Transcript_79/g.320  ORF Transcript_79/g.320 Transcript_79/m.320 type:complete len:214 (+) Transcript_79:274-915(+)